MRVRSRAIHLWVVAALLGGLAGGVLYCRPARDKAFVAQERLDAPAPALADGHTLGQTFLSPRDGLQGIDLLLLSYQPDGGFPEGATLSATLERLDDPRELSALVTLPLQGYQHNDIVSLRWEPLRDSGDTHYLLNLTASSEAGVGLWCSSTEAFAHGEMLADGQPAPGDLYFTAHYAYGWQDALDDAVSGMVSGLGMVPALVLLLLPGWVVLLLLPIPAWLDGWARLSLVIAVALSTWAILALWAGTVGVSLAGGSAWALAGIFAAVGSVCLWRGRRVFFCRSLRKRDHLADLAMAVVMLVVIGTRILHVRGLVVPPWVDSVHHTLLTELIRQHGGVPHSFEPYFPVGNLHYHFGFHSAAAALCWYGGLPSYRAVLILGQVLNAAAALAAYTFAQWLVQKRWAAVGAAVVAGTLSYLPAYYVSWGRYTQLAGLILLPAACLASTYALRKGGRTWVALAGFLAGGLFLTHYRVLIFYLAFWLAYLGFALWSELRGGSHRLWPSTLVMLEVGLLALLVTAPWVIRLARDILPRVGEIYGGLALSPGAASAFSWDVLTPYWGRWLLAATAIGLVWGLVRRQKSMVFLAVWVGLWLLAANPHVLGLPDSWLLDNAAVEISLWLPMAIVLGWLAEAAVSGLVALVGRLNHRWAWDELGPTIFLAGSVYVSLAGAWAHLDVANPITVLATEDDLVAMEWVKDNVPEDALLAINSRVWQGSLHMGTDGGWWLPLLTGRRVTLPAILYHTGEREYYEAVNALALTIERCKDPNSPEFLAALSQAGVTHVYLGARGGPLMPAALDNSPHYRALYVYGPVRVYELVP